MYVYTHIRIYTQTYTRKLTQHTHTKKQTKKQTNKQTHTNTHTHTHPRAHTHTRAHTHACTHARAYPTHTHTPAHTRARALYQIPHKQHGCRKSPFGGVLLSSALTMLNMPNYVESMAIRMCLCALKCVSVEYVECFLLWTLFIPSSHKGSWSRYVYFCWMLNILHHVGSMFQNMKFVCANMLNMLNTVWPMDIHFWRGRIFVVYVEEFSAEICIFGHVENDFWKEPNCVYVVCSLLKGRTSPQNVFLFMLTLWICWSMLNPSFPKGVLSADMLNVV